MARQLPPGTPRGRVAALGAAALALISDPRVSLHDGPAADARNAPVRRIQIKALAHGLFFGKKNGGVQ
ncbi:MAG: hypothetical protein HKO62_03920 [Gammaproteobacteria bacterium]|nr:hypothetical protein [Gammaproteobacteria bacterium]NNL99874.1 hypothetical protein [Gammaproteobacteria bacterium]